MTKLPDNPGSPSPDEDGRSLQFNIHGDLHYTPNDIAELRRLANEHPDLAKAVVSGRHDLAVREENTVRLGMVVTASLATVIVLVAGFTFVGLGWWQSICFVAALIGVSHILRTVLKGEFSDTSWFAKFLSAGTKGEEKKSTNSETEG